MNRLDAYVESHHGELLEIVQNLVRIPSENTPPTGEENACQQHISDLLKSLSWETELYSLTEVEGLESHELYWPGRDYHDRPNLSARMKGRGGGRSLILSGHIDTVPRGSTPWSRDPFGADLEEGRLYGRGANDMKGGVGVSLFVARALGELDIQLKGDLLIETVVDEEFGGVNGTLAGRLKGFNADAAVIGEPTFPKICPAQRGGHFAHITFNSPGGILLKGGETIGVVDQVRRFLVGIKEFSAIRRKSARVHDLYSHLTDPVPVMITRLFTAPWGNQEPIGYPETCKVEVYWQTMPGEDPAQVQAQFDGWFEDLVYSQPEVFTSRPVVESPLRWLPGSAISREHPLVTEFGAAAIESLGEEPEVAGIEAPCDMYVFHRFGIPAILWGPTGGNTHSADEYVEVDSLVKAARVLLNFVCKWCGSG